MSYYTLDDAIRNYLRVRGEYFRREVWAWLIAELPPRARRIQYFTIPP